MIWSISNDVFFCTIFTLQGIMIHLNLLDRFFPSAIPQKVNCFAVMKASMRLYRDV